MMKLQARVLREQSRFEEAKSEALRAGEVFEKLGAAQDLERRKEFLRDIQQELNDPVTSG